MTGTAYHKSLAAVAFALATAVPTAHAQDVRPMFKLGVDTGGDTLVTATFSSGSSDSIKANEGFYIGGGASILFSNEIEMEVSLSYKTASITASNGDIEFTRLPLDALVFYRFPDFRLGGGLTYHLNPKLSCSGGAVAAGCVNVSFDDAAGLALQADYLFAQKFAVGGRYTMLEYKASGGGTVKGNGLGVTFSVKF